MHAHACLRQSQFASQGLSEEAAMPCEGGRGGPSDDQGESSGEDASTIKMRRAGRQEAVQHNSNSDSADSQAESDQSNSPTQRASPLPEPIFSHHKTREKIRRAKRQHRSDIHWSEWNKYRYAESDFCEASMLIKENLSRIHKKDTSHVDFIRNFEIPGRPVLLCGWMDSWPALHKWDLESLRRNYRRAKFKVGEKDNGDKIRLQMKYFMDYLKHQNDDSPLYLFESAVEDKANTCGLLNDWQVPDLFPADLHSIVGEERRPPYRWFCIGPKRSGTTVHVDPLGTAAWNAVTSGYKRWALFPPGTSKQIVKGKHLMKPGEDDEPIMWFDKILPRIKEKYPDIPVYESLRKGRRRLAAHWFARLKHCFPEKEVYGRLVLKNKQDGWEVRGGKFCRVRASSGFATDVSSTSSSSSSSSSSASSDDEEELSELDQHVQRMRAAITPEAWKAYFEEGARQPSAPRPLPAVHTPLDKLTNPARANHAEKRAIQIIGCTAADTEQEPPLSSPPGPTTDSESKRQRTES